MKKGAGAPFTDRIFTAKDAKSTKKDTKKIEIETEASAARHFAGARLGLFLLLWSSCPSCPSWCLSGSSMGRFRHGSAFEANHADCTTGRQSLVESHRQRRWLTIGVIPARAHGSVVMSFSTNVADNSAEEGRKCRKEEPRS